MASEREMLFAGTVPDLQRTGFRVVHGVDRPIVVFYNDGEICAIENRCPHMGFPLHRGSCSNGIVTCPWHHARFDAQSGSTFDPFAGDAAPFDIEIRGREIFVSALPRVSDIAARARQRLREGLEMNNSLAGAKAILILREANAESDVLREAALFGAQHRDDWAAGLTCLTALANLGSSLTEQSHFLALYQSVRRIAQDCQGQQPHLTRFALGDGAIPVPRLRAWMREWIDVRHRDGAERTLLTAVHSRLPVPDLAALVFDAATWRIFSDGGHVVDFANKAFELLDIIGWEHAGQVFPTIAGRLVAGRGGEELTSWRTPVDLVALVEALTDELPALLAAGRGKAWHEESSLADGILGDDPGAIIDALRQALLDGAAPIQLAQSVAYAAAVRIARFHPSNEFGDWITVLHSFSYCHAMHCALRRTSDPACVRGVIHGAMSVYLNRFLNVPALDMPQNLGDLPFAADQLRRDLLASFDRLPQEDAAARLVARHYDLGHPIDPLIDTLTLAVLQEDADFHTVQMLEAAVREYFLWEPGEQQRTLLVAAARFLAAQAPTRRMQLQTARIALRLHRHEEVFDEAGEQDAEAAVPAAA